LKEKSKGRVRRIAGVYRGSQTLEFDDLTVYPAEQFLERLSKGEFLE
jgi:hypothetical protein